MTGLPLRFPKTWPDPDGVFATELEGLDSLVRGEAYPSNPDDILKAFGLTPFKKVRVVILGKDPYPNPDQAMGLAFSVRPTLRPHPRSLRNIFHELQTDLFISPPWSGDLTRWAKEEHILLLNCALTVGQDRTPHVQEWRKLTNHAIKLLNKRKGDPLVFLLWGEEAQRRAHLIDQPPHRVLCAYHPQDRGVERFFGCGHFSQTNRFFTENDLDPVDWRP